jgi:hypothetical protein
MVRAGRVGNNSKAQEARNSDVRRQIAQIGS